ncbi:MAG: zinc ribbon domain-containing protein [Thermoplasmata archaeon]
MTVRHLQPLKAAVSVSWKCSYSQRKHCHMYFIIYGVLIWMLGLLVMEVYSPYLAGFEKEPFSVEGKTITISHPVGEPSSLQEDTRQSTLVTLTSPSDGAHLSGVISIRWGSDGSLSMAHCILYYSIDSGTTWNIIDEAIPNTGNYTWDTANVPDGVHYRFNITIVSGSNSYYDSNDMDITITNGGSHPAVILHCPRTTQVTTSVPFFWSVEDKNNWSNLTFDLYIGTGSTMRRVAKDLNTSFYRYSGALNGVKYTWRVVPKYGKVEGTCSPASADFTINTGLSSNPPTIDSFYPSSARVDASPSSQPIFFFNVTDPNGEGIDFFWFFDLQLESHGSGTRTSFTPPASRASAGSHQVRVYMVNQKGQDVYGNWTLVVSTPNSSPVAVITSPANGSTVYANTPLLFDGNSSFDPEGDSLIYSWYLDSLSISSQPYLIMNVSTGQHTLTLTVWDTKMAHHTAAVYFTAVSRPLAVISIKEIIIYPSKPSDGEDCTITVVVENKGEAAATSFSAIVEDYFEGKSTQIAVLGFEGVNGLSQERKILPWTPSQGHHTITAQLVLPPHIAAGSSTTFSSTIVVSASIPWLFIMIIVILVIGIIVAAFFIFYLFFYKKHSHQASESEACEKETDDERKESKSVAEKSKEHPSTSSHTAEKRLPEGLPDEPLPAQIQPRKKVSIKSRSAGSASPQQPVTPAGFNPALSATPLQDRSFSTNPRAARSPISVRPKETMQPKADEEDEDEEEAFSDGTVQGTIPGQLICPVCAGFTEEDGKPCSRCESEEMSLKVKTYFDEFKKHNLEMVALEDMNKKANDYKESGETQDAVRLYREIEKKGRQVIDCAARIQSLLNTEDEDIKRGKNIEKSHSYLLLARSFLESLNFPKVEEYINKAAAELKPSDNYSEKEKTTAATALAGQSTLPFPPPPPLYATPSPTGSKSYGDVQKTESPIPSQPSVASPIPAQRASEADKTARFEPQRSSSDTDGTGQYSKQEKAQEDVIIKKPAAMNKCPRCQKIVKKDWSICPYCDNILKEPDKSSPGGSSPPSSASGAGFAQDGGKDALAPLGQARGAQSCPNCSKPVSPIWQICPYCQKRIKPSQEKNQISPADSSSPVNSQSSDAQPPSASDGPVVRQPGLLQTHTQPLFSGQQLRESDGPIEGAKIDRLKAEVFRNEIKYVPSDSSPLPSKERREETGQQIITPPSSSEQGASAPPKPLFLTAAGGKPPESAAVESPMQRQPDQLQQDGISLSYRLKTPPPPQERKRGLINLAPCPSCGKLLSPNWDSCPYCDSVINKK